MTEQAQPLQAAAAYPLHSDAFGELAGALAKARGAFKPIIKGREVTVKTKAGGSYKFKYAELVDIYEATDSALAEHGLAHSSSIRPTSLGMVLVTTLMHESGEWLRSYMTLGQGEGDPQAFGSLLTYYRRYAISALLGVSSEEDDDGNASVGNAVTDSRANPPPDTASGVPAFETEAALITFTDAVSRAFGKAQSVAEAEDIKAKNLAKLTAMRNSPAAADRDASARLKQDYDDAIRVLQAAERAGQKPSQPKTVADALRVDLLPDDEIPF